DADDDEEEEESSDDNEEDEHLAPAVALRAFDLVPSAEETKLFETDESAATPPPPPPAYRTTSKMSVQSQTPILFPSEEEVARLFALPTLLPSLLTPLSSPLPQIPSPPTHHPLPLPAPSTSCRANIPEAEQSRFNVAHRVDYGFMDTLDASIHASEHKAMAAVESVNLRINYQASVHRRESEEYIEEVPFSLCTTHEQERVEARQALDRSDAHIRALEAQIAVLETQAYRQEWQRQDADDRATGHIMRIQELEAGARVDTFALFSICFTCKT
ncbi:hypothetical protein Tco_0029615, partial [Tanacetum coccineum]